MSALVRLVSLFFVILVSAAYGLSEAREPAGSAEDPVEIEGEPFHSIRLINSIVRVYEAQIPVASQTLFHRHRYGGAGIDMTATRLSVEKVGETLKEEFVSKPGELFPLDLSSPFVHKVVNTGALVYRVVVVELLRAPAFSSGSSTVAAPPNYKLELETDRVRAYRLTLRPGEVTQTHTLRAQTLVVSVSGGQLSVNSVGRPDRLVSYAPAALEWNSADSTMTLTNVGVSTYESIYFEWKSASQK
jgi:hypothetical protein